MEKNSRVRNAPALAVASLALVAAATGGATAATMINGSRLVNNTVTSAKITNGTLQKADMKPLVWKALTPSQGWTAYGGFGTTPQYSKDALGFVHLRGTLDGSARSGTVFATLPTGFRPPQGAWVNVASTNGSGTPTLANLSITSVGQIVFTAGAGANGNFVSLEGVTFYAG